VLALEPCWSLDVERRRGAELVELRIRAPGPAISPTGPSRDEIRSLGWESGTALVGPRWLPPLKRPVIVYGRNPCEAIGCRGTVRPRVGEPGLSARNRGGLVCRFLGSRRRGDELERPGARITRACAPTCPVSSTQRWRPVGRGRRAAGRFWAQSTTRRILGAIARTADALRVGVGDSLTAGGRRDSRVQIIRRRRSSTPVARVRTSRTSSATRRRVGCGATAPPRNRSVSFREVDWRGRWCSCSGPEGRGLRPARRRRLRLPSSRIPPRPNRVA